MPYTLPFFRSILISRKYKSKFTKIRFLILLIALVASSAAFAQKRSILKGQVIDSLTQQSLNKATVAVINVRDSALVAYTLSDQAGSFTLHNLPSSQKIRIIVSYVTYSNYRKDIVVDKGGTIDLGVINLNRKTVGLKEVSVKGERSPVAIHKDTIEFSAEAFKVKPNAVVEELLNKLPGLQVNSDGTIMSNGKTVSKILVNGHEYFSNDPRIASKNLEAAMIDKVQIYDDRENDPDNLIDESKVNKIINLKFKKKYRKSFFGKIYGGAGSDSRYESGILFNSLADTLQVSLIGYSNNLSHTAFSRDDLSSLGGFNRSGMDQLNDGYISTGGKLTDGIEKVSAIGLNVNDDYGKKLKLNFLFFLNHSDDLFKRTSFNQNFLNDTSLFSNQINNKSQHQTSYNFSSLIQYSPSPSVQIKYSPHLLLNKGNLNNEIFSDQRNDFNQHINTEIDTLQTYNRPNQFDHMFSYYKKINDKGESITFTNKLQVNTTHANNFLNNNLISYISDIASDTLHQLNNTITKNTLINSELSFRIPLSKKLSGSLAFVNAYTKNKENIEANAFNEQSNTYNEFLSDQSANISRRNLTETLRPGFTYKIGNQVTVIAELSTQWQDVVNHVNSGNESFNNRYFYLLPSLSLQAGNFSFNYNQSITQPVITDLNPTLVKVNSYYSFIGNPFLAPMKSNNFTLNYYHFNFEKQTSLFVLGNASFNENSFYNHIEFNTFGIQTVHPLNGGKSNNVFLGANFIKKFKEFDGWTISVKTSLYQGFRNSIVSVNNNTGNLHYYYTIGSAEFQFNYKNVIEIDPRYEVDPSYSSYKNISYPNVTNVNQKLTLKYGVRFSDTYSLDGDYTRFYSSQLNYGFQKSTNMLNAAFAVQIQKEKRGQLKLSAFDLLNQNISVFRTVSGNGIYQGENLIQKRYFLLTYQYKFAKGNSR